MNSEMREEFLLESKKQIAILVSNNQKEEDFMRSKVSIVVVVSLLFCLISCGTDRNQKAVGEEKQYSIIKEEKMGNIKSTIDIRLKSDVDKEALTKIANKLKKDGRSNYQRIFINYYLPEMEVGEGAWATSHFNPDLEVQILGITKEEKDKLLKEKSPVQGNLIGRWLDDTLFVESVYTISRIGGVLKLTIKYKDGSESVKKLTEKIANKQKRWIEEDNDFGEYYVLNDDGNLSIYDNQGLIRTLSKVK